MWSQQMEFRHELVIPNENFPFKLFLFEGKDGNYKRAGHWHRSIEIFLVLEGAVHFHVNAADSYLSGKDFIIVNSNEVHSIEAPEPNKTLVLQIPLSVLEPYLGEQSYLVFEKREEEVNQELVGRIAKMYRAYEERSYAYELQVEAQFRLLLHLLLTRFKRENLAPDVIQKKIHLDQLSEITDYMKRHYHEELSLEKVADRFGFSPTYLSRIFRRYADINYRTYLMDLRVEYAVRELTATSHEIGDVAAAHGFSDSRAFSKAFKKRYGCLPSEYRKKRNR